MREILFKAKRKNWQELNKEGQWVYGYYVHGFNVYEEPIHIIFDPTTVFHSHGETDGWDEIDITTICQYTGLNDKNGNKIWENDIVKCGKTCTVTWCDTFASWRLNTTGWMYSHFFGEACKPEDVEVIGNVFDNPELLEQ